MTVRPERPKRCSRKVRRSNRSLMVACMRTGMPPLSVPSGTVRSQGTKTAPGTVNAARAGPAAAGQGRPNLPTRQGKRQEKASRRVSLEAPAARGVCARNAEGRPAPAS